MRKWHGGAVARGTNGVRARRRWTMRRLRGCGERGEQWRVELALEDAVVLESGLRARGVAVRAWEEQRGGAGMG